MEEKKNNQVQAMDDDKLENISGGFTYDNQTHCKFCGRPGATLCRDCRKFQRDLESWGH